MSGETGVALSEPRLPAELFSRRLVGRVFPAIVIGVLAYGGLLLYADAGAFSRSIARISFTTYAAAVSLSLGNFFLRYLRWVYYLRRLGIRVPLGESALIFVAGFAMSITPGKVGELLKSLLLKASRDIPVARTSSIVVAERVTDIVGLLLLGAGGSVALGGVLLSAVFFGLAGCVLLLCSVAKLGTALISLVARLRWLSPHQTKLEAAHGSLLELTRPGPLGVGILIAVLAWGLQCLCVWVFASCFPDVELGVSASLVAYSAPLLAGSLSLIPGGLGLTEASMTGAIRALGAPGATRAVAATITVLVRLASFWLAIALGFAALLAWRTLHRLHSPP